MELYITKIILPYLVDTKRKLKLPPSHPALLLFDNFKGQCTEKLLKLLDTNMVNVVLILSNCTDRLQPLDLSVNKAAKEFLQKFFQKWYALKEKHQRNLRLSVMKPIGVKWLVELHDYMTSKPEIIKNGFKEAGILNCTT